MTAAEIDSFFARSEATLLASLKRGRSKRDSAFAAVQRQEVQDFIRQDRQRALEGLAGEAEALETETAKGEDPLRRLAEEEEEETLGDVSHSEVLQMIQGRLREDPELRRILEESGEKPEEIAAQVQGILRNVSSEERPQLNAVS